jgi:hypothetical protein
MLKIADLGMARLIFRIYLLTLLAILLAISVAPVPRVRGATATIMPSNADTFLSLTDPSSIVWPYTGDTNFGDSTPFLVDPGNGGSDYYNLRRGLVRFDLPSVLAGSTINDAHLKLRNSGIGWTDDPSNEILYAYRVTEDWAEMQATWNSRLTGTAWTGTDPAGGGGTWTVTDAASATIPGTSTGYWMDWDVKDIVKAWVENGQPNYGFIIASPSLKDWTIGFSSREASATYQPTLVVDYARGSQCIADAPGNANACFQASAGAFSGLTAVAVSSVSPPPPAAAGTFPDGLFSFTVSGLSPGQTVTVTITLSSPLPAGTFSYWKLQSGVWSQFSSASLDSTRTIITLTFTASGSGTVTDPGGPAFPSVVTTSAPVGGFVEAVNKVAVFAPYLALFGIVAAVAVVVWKKRES